eukprot:TRINITY_DN355_c0_g1_i1.p1 TRINITY_DN355_c0_g1~~TRINITY_DN355_c0_g1_i1.p1  ORF type:complete len:896 (-),score=202.27 TRINITY_DN355_c0_g1_i1:4495-7182(-)
MRKEQSEFIDNIINQNQMDYFSKGGIDYNNIEQEIKKASQFNAADLKELGLDGDEEEDPEMRELEKEARNFKFDVKGKEMREEDLEKMDVNEEDLNDPEILKELGEFGEEDDKEEQEEARKKLEKLEAEIKKCISSALGHKKKGETKEAIQFIKQKKALEQEKAKLLQEFPQLANKEKQEPNKAPEPEKPPQQLVKKEVKKEQVKVNIPSLGDVSKLPLEELEIKIHNLDRMAAVSVMDAEMELMTQKASKASKDDAALFEEKKGSIEFRRNMLVNNIQMGLVTQEKYMAEIAAELDYEKAMLEALKKSNSKSEDIKRVEKRIELINQELAGPPPEEEEPESKEEVKKEEKPTALKEQKEPSPAPKQEKMEDVKPQRAVQEEEVLSPPVIVEDENIDFTKVNKLQYDTVLNRLKDYREAIEYFVNNGMQKRTEQFIKKMNRLNACLKVIKEGKKIDLIKIDPPLTPEIMFDQDIENRVKAFQLLIEKLQAQLAQQKALAKEYIEKSKKDKFSKGTAEKHVKKAEENAKLIAAVKENMKNQWQPLPLYHIETVQEEKEVIQEDVGPLEVMIDYTPDSQLAGKDYRIDYIVATKEETAKGSFEASKKASIKAPLPKSARHIERGEAALTLASKSLLIFNKSHGTMKLKLDKFAKQGKIPVQFTDDSKKYKMEVIFKIRKPTKAKELAMHEYKELVIDHFYPPFRAKDSQKVSMPSAPPRDPGSAVAPKSPMLEEQKTKKPTSEVVKGATAGKDPPLPSPLPNLPKILREADVKDPDDAGNLICSSYLDKKIEAYTATVKQLTEKSQKIPPAMKEKLSVMTKNKAVIEAQIGSGKLTSEMYKKFLESQLQKDQVLFSYLKSLGQTSKMSIVKDRILCIQKELASFQQLNTIYTLYSQV